MIYIIFLLFTFSILYLFFYEWQYYMVFSPVYYREDDLDENYEMLSLKTDDGFNLEGVVYEPKEASGTMLFFAGRAHDVIGTIKKLSISYPNTTIVSFNYRSYGRSEGVANEKNINADGLKIAQFVEEKYGSFYMLGYSLGSSVASYVASISTCRALFLVGAFDSIANVAKEKFVVRSFFPMIDLSNIFRYKFKNIQYVKKIDAPTYLFASKDDETTYIQNARNLRDNVKNLALYMELIDLSHKDILWNDTVVNKINEVIK